MTIFMKRLVGVAAMAALAVPTMAMAAPGNPAASLSVAGSNVRASAKAKGTNKLGGSMLINLAIFAVLVGGGLAIISNSDKSKSP